MASTISVNVIADVKNIKSGLQDVNGKLTGFQSTIGKVGGFLKGAFAGAAVLGGFSALKSGLTSVIDEARESQKVGAETDRVLQSMGNVAGISAKGIGDLAGALSNKTAIDDEVIQSGANLLATFGNVRNEVGKGNDVFSRTTALGVDMASVLGTDVNSSMLQLGKALNDPIKGITALTRSGVSFTEQQKEQIKALTESGDLLGAQKIILGEVEKQFGGAAEAAANPMEKLKITIGNLKESIGTVLLPIIDRLATYLVEKLPGWIETAKGAWETLKSAFDTAKPVLEAIGLAFMALGTFIVENSGFFVPFAGLILTIVAALKVWAIAQAALNLVMAANPFVLVAIAVAALVAGLIYAYQESETFRNIVNGVFNAVKAVGEAVFGFLKGFITGAFDFIKDKVIPAVTGTKDAVVNAWNALKDTVTNAVNAVKDKVVEVFNAIKEKVTSAANAAKDAAVSAWNAAKERTTEVFNAIKNFIGEAMGAVKEKVSSGVTNAKQALTDGFNAAKTAVSTAWTNIRTAVADGITQVVNLARGIGGQITGAVGNLGGILKGAGRAIIQGLIDGVTGMIGSLRAKFSSITRMIPNWKGPLPKDKKLLLGAGEAIMGGLIKGISNEERALKSELGHVTDIIAGTTLPGLALGDTTIGSGSFTGGLGGTTVINVTVNAPVGSNAADIGRELDSYLASYARSGGRRLSA